MRQRLAGFLDEGKRRLGLASDAELAKAIGVAARTLSGYRRGHAVPAEPACMAIAEAADAHPVRVLLVAAALRDLAAERAVDPRWESLIDATPVHWPKAMERTRGG